MLWVICASSLAIPVNWRPQLPTRKRTFQLMGRILAISSYVAFGHVGLAAVVPALQAMRHQVIAVPTVVLSNHYGYPHVGDCGVSADNMVAILNGLRNNGWLNEIDAVITGYLPSADHVAIIAEEIDLLRVTTPELRYLCDPVLGDDPEGLYVSEALADAVGQELLPIADIITPNRFELSWLTDTEVSEPDEAAVAIRDHKGRLVVATSIPAGDGLIANCLSGTEHQSRIVTRQHDAVPHGTGDLFAALLLGHLLAGRDAADALARATVGVRTVIEASLGAEELRLIDTIQEAIAAETAGVTSA